VDLAVFDPRSDGHAKLSALIEATELFESRAKGCAGARQGEEGCEPQAGHQPG
jgi:hypothetical protein